MVTLADLVSHELQACRLKRLCKKVLYKNEMILFFVAPGQNFLLQPELLRSLLLFLNFDLSSTIPTLVSLCDYDAFRDGNIPRDDSNAQKRAYTAKHKRHNTSCGEAFR